MCYAFTADIVFSTGTMVICDDTILVVQNCTADIMISTCTMVICDERWTAASRYGLHLGNLKSGRKESRVCFATEVAHSRQGAAFSLGNRRNTRWMGSGAARMQGVRVTPGCFNPHSNNYRMVPLRRFAASRRVRSQRPHRHDASNKN